MLFDFNLKSINFLYFPIFMLRFYFLSISTHNVMQSLKQNLDLEDPKGQFVWPWSWPRRSGLGLEDRSLGLESSGLGLEGPGFGLRSLTFTTSLDRIQEQRLQY
jgi:hypothetical protein